jgi:hypothetical protein
VRTSLRICAAAAALALGSVHASACDDGCGWDHGRWGYGSYSTPPAPTYYAPPVYSYATPPVYAYSYAPPVSYYAPTAYGYYAPVAAFRGPRWDYSYDRYYTAPVVYGAPWGRYRPYAGPGYYGGPRYYAGPRSYGGPRFYARTYRVYARGPIHRGWRRW